MVKRGSAYTILCYILNERDKRDEAWYILAVARGFSSTYSYDAYRPRS